TDELVASEAYRRFYMHQTSHWLGLDVHDVGTYRPGGEPDLPAGPFRAGTSCYDAIHWSGPVR
ncbi:MAG TPA: hypothetical protein VFG08_03290, partial [Candidatus Polarisedimenticolia bacterium]|nr:hypothetical protein [Candidatus Polarisedimenticolia bacterium]